MAGLAGCSGILGSGDDGGGGSVEGGGEWLPLPQDLAFDDGLVDEEQVSQDVYDRLTERFDLQRYHVEMGSPSAVVSDDRINDYLSLNYEARWVNYQYANPLASEVDLVVRGYVPAATPLADRRPNQQSLGTSAPESFLRSRPSNTQMFEVAVGSFDPDRIANNLRADDYSPTSPRDEYEFFESDEGDQAYAFSESTLIRVSIPNGLFRDSQAGEVPTEWRDYSAEDVVERAHVLIDAKEEVVSRYGDEDPDLGTLQEQVPAGQTLSYELWEPDQWESAYEDRQDRDPDVERGEFAEHVASGHAQQIVGEETEVSKVLAFTTDRAIVEREIQTYVQEAEEFRNWRTVDFSIDGNVVTIEGSIRTLDLL